MELPQLRWSMNISAREVVVLGVVRGDINASERVDLRSEGSLSGDVIRHHDWRWSLL
jgi:cytoskeletal protein CcmA (bactofilin family)